MKEFFQKGWIGKLMHSVKAISKLNIPVYAANAGYFIILAIFPLLILLMSLLRHTGLEVEVLLEILDRGNINLDYLYVTYSGLSRKPVAILRAVDIMEVEEFLKAKGYQMLERLE